MTAYYNEIDAYCAQWLRNLIGAGHIPMGDVDERDIREVSRRDLKGYGQCHFFAGLGGWGYACRLAGIPDDQPVWTGSCPCQPFSSAGQRRGVADERHLWPAFFKLIEACHPPVVFGEQVASADVLGSNDEEMHEVWTGEAVRGFQKILGERPLWATTALQDLPETVRETLAFTFGGIPAQTAPEEGRGEQDLFVSIPSQTSRTVSGSRVSETQREEELAVRPRRAHRLYTGQDGQGRLRDDWLSVGLRAAHGPTVQYSFDRQDRTIERLRLQQYQSDLFCGERDVGGLGRGGGVSDGSVMDNEEGPIDDKQTTSAADFGESDEAAPVWIDGVFNDLEGAGYACAAADLPAAAVGAPHIRQRLWWVASNSSVQPWVYQPNGWKAPARLLNHKTYWETNPWHEATPKILSVDDGLPDRLDATHGFGNAIVPQLAAEFMMAFRECRP